MRREQTVGSRHAEKRVLWLVITCTALSLSGDSALYAVLPSCFDRFGLLVLHVGWLLSVNRLVRLPLNLPSGWLIRRIGPKWPFVIGLSLGSLSTFGLAFFSSLWLLLSARVLWGVAWSLIVIASYEFVFEAGPREKRGLSTGIYVSFTRFGGALGGMLGSFLLDALGRWPSMTILAACGAFGAALALVLPNPRAVGGSAESFRFPVALIHRGRWLRALATVEPTLWIVLLYNFVHLLVYAGIVYSTFGLYLRSALGEEIGLAGSVVGVASLTGTLLFARNVFALISSPLVGALSDRSGRRARALILAESLGVLSLVLLGLGGSSVVLAVGIAITCVSYGVAPALLLAWLGDHSIGRSGTATGGFRTAGDLGSGLGPLLAYPLIAWLGIHATYLVAAGLIAIAAMLVYYVDRTADKSDATLKG